MSTIVGRAALDALKIDERLAEAHAALGYVEHRFDWDWSGAPSEFALRGGYEGK
jgi:hypothetical protein